MKNILITGSSGFIGQALVERLCKNKKNKLYLIINKKKINSNSKRIKFINCNLYNKLKLEKKLSTLDITDVIHCAWNGVNANDRNSITQKKNLFIIRNLFYAINKKKIKTFIGIGSQAEYKKTKKKINENTKLIPITKYGQAKVSVYNFIKNKCEDKKIRYVWLRVFSGYGPKSNKKWIIPFVISKLLKRNKIEFTAGEQIYNFIFINDIVSAIVKSLSQLKAYGAYNLGHENSYKIKSVISIIFKKLKIKEKPIFGSLKYRNDQVMSFNPSINKIKKDLNWKPKYSLSKGLDMTIRYFKSKLK